MLDVCFIYHTMQEDEILSSSLSPTAFLEDSYTK